MTGANSVNPASAVYGATFNGGHGILTENPANVPLFFVKSLPLMSGQKIMTASLEGMRVLVD